jgi:hypothetical protein
LDANRERLYVQIGLQQRLFTQAQLDDARRAAPGKPIPDALQERGVLGREQHRGLDRAVSYRLGRDDDKRIAQIIVDSGYCSEQRVEDALRRQKDFYGKTGELVRICQLLVEDGTLTDSQHLAASKIFRIERTSIAKAGPFESV